MWRMVMVPFFGSMSDSAASMAGAFLSVRSTGSNIR